MLLGDISISINSYTFICRVEQVAAGVLKLIEDDSLNGEAIVFTNKDEIIPFDDSDRMNKIQNTLM